jgi:uncharacterized lipoprotein
MHVLRLCLVLALSALVQACAFNSQTVKLAPQPVVAATALGQGVELSVEVVDERPSQSLGRRGGGFGPAAEITTDQDVAAVVHAAVVDGVRRHGFAIAAGASAPAHLKVELRLLEYSTSQGFWTGGVQVQAALKATALRNGKSFEQLYRSDNENRVMIVPTAGTNEEWINAGLSDVLGKLLSDTALLEALRR